MRAHWNFKGVFFPNAWGRIGSQWVKSWKLLLRISLTSQASHCVRMKTTTLIVLVWNKLLFTFAEREQICIVKSETFHSGVKIGLFLLLMSRCRNGGQIQNWPALESWGFLCWGEICDLFFDAVFEGKLLTWFWWNKRAKKSHHTDKYYRSWRQPC